jgi:hypothetical protein
LFDLNHDGLLTKAEVAKMFHLVIVQFAPDSTNLQETVEASMAKIMSIVDKVFGNKTKLSEQEFCEILLENDEAGDLFGSVLIALRKGLTGAFQTDN